MLEIRNLSVILENINKRFYILRDINLNIENSEILGLVGESGSGKTVLGKTILNLIGKPIRKISGEIFLNDRKLDKKNIDEIRGRKISMIFQNPTSCLNPVFTIKNQLVETIRNFNPNFSKNKAINIAVDLLEKVEIDNPKERLNTYPHNLSGGMNQRVMIALALSTNPDILIADEPTTALDVTVQSAIINLLKRLNKSIGLSILFITHDINLIKSIADRVAVIYAGEIVEILDRNTLENSKFRHPYTKLLHDCVPTLEKKQDFLTTIQGEIAVNNDEFNNKCIFYDRCPRAIEICQTKKPDFNNNCKCFNPIVE